MPNTSRFVDAETGKESNVYGEMCSEHVPFRYLFSAKRIENCAIAATFPPAGRDASAHAEGSRLHAPGRAAVGWVEEYGHPAASDATEGRTVAKKTAFRARLRCRNNSARIDLAEKTGPGSDVTGP